MGTRFAAAGTSAMVGQSMDRLSSFKEIEMNHLILINQPEWMN